MQKRHNKLLLTATLIGGIAFSLLGCSDDSQERSAPNPVSIQQEIGYYDVKLNFTDTSHFEVGRQFASAIKRTVPDYEQVVDRALYLQMSFLSRVGLTFDIIRTRAQTLLDNPKFHAAYRDEIVGMQEVFSYQTDELDDGKLSANELLVFQFVPDVMRAYSCSATAAYGNATTTGKTIIGRNLEWINELIPEIAKIYAITTFRNGDTSVVNMGVLGQLFAISMLNDKKLFAAILDSATSDLETEPKAIVPYPGDLSQIRSYSFDLRYAMENFAELSEVSGYMTAPDHVYAFNHLIFLADDESAGVVENDINLKVGTPGNRSLRSEDSILSAQVPEDQQWPIRDAIATVNDFRLPGNDYAAALSDTARWTSFRELYAGLMAGQRIDVDAMKGIVGYHPPTFGLMEEGAIFVHETSPEMDEWVGLGDTPLMFNTIQSIVLDMSTLDLWVSFTPWDDLLTDPVYRKVKNPLQ
jgi:hypothetical protein